MSRCDKKVLDFSELKGLTLTKVERDGNDRIAFYEKSGRKFQMLYYNDCCASCSIEEIHGDLEDLVGLPILMAEEVTSGEPTPELQVERDREKAHATATGEYYPDYSYESQTWTFYKAATNKGSVTIRWYGSSNGYYSEVATFEEIV